jgi:hypothetical protein
VTAIVAVLALLLAGVTAYLMAGVLVTIHQISKRLDAVDCAATSVVVNLHGRLQRTERALAARQDSTIEAVLLGNACCAAFAPDATKH